MATIMHGRRKGQDTKPHEINLEFPNQQHGSRSAGGRMEGTDLRQVTVLTKADWDRIQKQLNRRQLEEDRLRRAQEEKERLHNMCKEQVKNWGNTIVGQRQKKLEARKIREDKEEEEKKIIDIEEAKYQAQKRKEAIEKAKTQQYYQTDRVKGFHGALLLTEVLKEREAQLELKHLKAAASNDLDNEWLLKARQDRDESILRDQEQAINRIHRARDTAAFQKAQVHNHLTEVEKEVHEDKQEGEELKRLAAQYELERKRLEEIRNGESKNLMADNLEQIDDVRKMRLVNKQQEEEEDEECRIFAAAKRKMMKLRSEKEKQLHMEKQERLEKIRDKLHAQMLQKLDDEDERIHRATEEAEAKRAKEEAEKEGKIRKQYQDIAHHRTTQLEERERQAAEERRRELEMLAVKKQADEVFTINEDEKRSRRLTEMKGLQGFHVSQMDEKVGIRKDQVEEQLAQDRKNMALLDLEEKQFQEYASKVIDHCERGGRNVYPLRKAALEGAGGGLGPVFPGKGGVRPSYMVADQSGVQLPNYQRSTTDETKRTVYGDGQTQKRLGFVWS